MNLKFRVLITNLMNFFIRKIVYKSYLLILGFVLTLIPEHINAQCAAVGNPNSGQQGISLCSPVTKNILYSFDFISPVKPPAGANVQIRWKWNDGQADPYTYKIAKITGTPLFEGSPDTIWTASESAVRVFPDRNDLCEYEVEVYLIYQGFLCTDSRQQQDVASWHEDNEHLGVVTITPLEEQICEGDALINFQFNDASTFACNVCVTPPLLKPNNRPRWVQFVYGTNPIAGQGIPNLKINNGGDVFLTNPDGSPISFPTRTHFYEGPVVQTPFDQCNGSQLTFPISFDGIGTVANDQFQVTMRNWNFCNAYDPVDTLDPAPITATARILIVDAPNPPTVQNKAICFGGDRSLTVTSAPEGILRWYSNATLTTQVATGATYTQPQTAAGTYNYWVTDSATTGLRCVSQPTQVTLTINPIPNQPTISNAGPLSFCFGTNSVTLTANPNTPPAISSLQWTKDGSAYSTSNPITLDQVAQSGIYRVQTYGIPTTNCPSPQSNPVTVTINALATTTDPADRTRCELSNTTFSVTTGGPLHSWRWEVSTNGGANWSDVNNGGVYSGAGTATLTLTSIPYSYDNYQYRMRVTTNAGSCVTYSNPATLVVNPLPVINTPPANTSACENASADFSVVASIPEGSIQTYAWYRRIPSGSFQQITPAMDGSIYTNYDTSILTINPILEAISNYQYRVNITSAAGCTRTSTSGTLTVNLLADITTHPVNTQVCATGNTSFTVATDGSPAATYQWEVNDGGGWDDATVGIYSGGTTTTLSLTGVPLGYNNYQYRCRFRTTGPCYIYSNTAILTVNPLPTAGITPAAPGEFCAAETQAFNGNPAGGTGGYTHTWTGSGSGYLSNTTVQTPTFTAPAIGSQTNYTLIYTVTDTKTCKDSDNISVTVNPDVTVNVTRDIAGEVCSGTVIHLDGNAGGGTPLFSHTWTGSGAAHLNFTNIETPVFTAPVVGGQTSYSLTYTATDTKLCSDNQTINIVVNPNPSSNITLSDAGPLCYNETSNLNGNPAGGTPVYTHEWTGTGSPFLSSTTSQTPTFTTPSIGAETIYTLNYRIRDSKECESTDAETMTVFPHVQNAVISGDTSICAGQPANLFVTITGGVGPYNVQYRDDLMNPFSANPYNSGDAISTGALGATRNYTLVSVTDANGCTATNRVGNPTVTVGSPLLSAALAGGIQVCFGTTVNLKVNINGGAPPYSVVIGGFGTQNNYSSGTNIPLIGLAVGTHVYTLTSVTDACLNVISGAAVSGGNPQNVIVDPKPDASTTVNNASIICNNSSTNIDLNANVAGTLFDWTVTDLNGAGASAGSGVIGTKIAQVLTNATNNVDSVTYHITPTGPAPTDCDGTTVDRTVQIEPIPVAQTSVANITICSGENISFDITTPTVPTVPGNLSFDYTAGSSNPGATGGTAWNGGTGGLGVAFPLTKSGTITNSSAANITVTYTITPKYSVCNNGSNVQVVVTVKPEPRMADLDKTICSDIPTGITLSVDAGSTSASTFDITDIDNKGLTASAGSPSFPVSGTGPGTIADDAWTNKTNAPVVVEYTVRAVGDNGCTGPDSIIYVTINPEPDLQNLSTTVCSDEPSALTLAVEAAGVPAANYNIGSITNNGLTASAGNPTAPKTGVAANEIADDAWTNKTSGNVNVVYSVVPVSAATCAGDAENVTITVPPEPILANLDKTICSDATTSITLAVTGTSTPANLFNITAINPNGLTASAGSPAIANNRPANEIFDDAWTNTTAASVNVIYSVQPIGTNGCTGDVYIITVTIRPEPVLANLTRTVCSDLASNLTLSVAGGSIAASTYNITNINSNGLTASAGGPVTGIGFPANVIANDAWTNNASAVNVDVIYTVVPVSAATCQGDPKDVTVTIRPEPVLNNLSTTVCSDEVSALTLSVVPTGVSAANYNINSITNNGLTASAGNPTAPKTGVAASEIANDAWTNKTGANVNVIYSVVPLSPSACQGDPKDVTVTVRPEPVLANLDKTICSDVTTGITLAVAGGSIGAASYNIITINNGGLTASAGNPVTGPGKAAGEILDDAWTNKTANPVNVVYTVQPVGTNGCAGDNYTITVTINPEPTLADLNNSTCSDTPTGVTLSTAAGSVAATLFNITALNQNGLTASGGSPGTGNDLTAAVISDDQYTNKTGADVDVTYTIVPKSAATCLGDPKNVVITVGPEPVLANLNKTVCSDEVIAINLAVAGGSTPASSFNITAIQNNGLTASAGNPTAPKNSVAAGEISDDAWTNTTGAPVNVVYSVQPIGTNTCLGDVYTITVTVNPEPVLANLSAIICSDAPSGLNLSVAGGSVAAANYNITNINSNGLTSSGGSPATGNGLAATVIADDAWNNISSASVNVVYTVVPVAAGGCQGNAKDVTLAIKPEPVVTAGQNPTTCSDVQLDYQILLDNFTNPGDNVTFTWPAPDLSGTLTGGTARNLPGSSANITDKFTNTSGILETATYHITPSYNGCAGDIVDVEVGVAAEPILADLDDEACSDVAIGLVFDVAPGSVAASNYDVSGVVVHPSLNIISQAAVPNTNVSDTYLQNDTYRNMTGGDLTVVYTVTPKFSPTCVGDPKDVTITIHPEPIVLLPQTKTICSGQAVNKEILLNPANVPPGSEFRWNKPIMSDASDQSSAQSNVVADPAGTIHITDVLINEDVTLPYTNITATYLITPTSTHGCDGDQVPLIITVKPKPNTSAISGADDACINTANMVYSVTPTGGSKYYWHIPALLGTVTFGGNINDAFFIMNAAGAGAADTITVYEQNSFLCWGDTIKKAVEIYDYPPAALVAGDNFVCAGDTGLTYSVPDNTGSVYNWTVPIGAGITSFPVNVHQITVTFGTMSGNVSVVETNPAGCVTNHTPLNITVNALPNATIAPSKSVICEDEAVTFTASPAGAANYVFYVDGVEAKNSASRTYVTDSLVNGQGVSVEVTSAAGCMKESPASYVTVSPPPVVTVTSSDADNRICIGTSVTFTASSAFATGFNFRVNGTSKQSGASVTYITSALANGDAVDVIGTTIYGCTGTSNSIVTTVDPLPVAVLGSNDTICEGTSTNLAVTVTTGTGPYRIEIGQGVGIIDPYNSGDPISVSPVATTTYNLQSVVDAHGCSVTAPHANLTGQPKVVVHDDITITIQPSPTTKCPGTTATFSVGAMGTNPAYRWRRNGVNLNNDGRITGVTTTNLSIANVSAADAGNYDVVVSGACVPDTSIAVVLTVLEDIQVTSNPVSVVECPGLPVGFKVNVTGTSPVYRWRKNGTPITDGGTISGTDTDSLGISSITTLDAGNYDVVITGTCKPDTSSIATLTLNKQPQITSQPSNKIVCETGTTFFRVNAGTTTNPTYTWMVDENDGSFDTITGGVYTGFNDDTLYINGATATMNGYRYKVIIGGTCDPDVASNEVTLTVNNLPEITAEPLDSTVCEGSTVAFTVNPGVTTSPGYTWEVNNGSGWSVISGAPYSGYNTNTLGILNATSALDSFIFRVTVSGTCAPAVLSAEANLYVLEKPEVSSHPVAVTECEDGTVFFAVKPGITTAPVYQWQVDNGGGFGDVSGGIYTGINADTLVISAISSGMNGYRYRALVTGTCTPEAYSNPAKLTVEEKPEITIHPVDKIICENANTIFIVNPGVTTNPGFIWEYDKGSGWTAVIADANHSGINNDTLYITSAQPAMNGYKYRVIVGGNCTPFVTSDSALLTVYERPEILLDPVDETICEDDTISFTTNAGLTTNPTYQWQVSTGGGFNNIFGGSYSGENTATLTVNGGVSAMNGYRYRVIVGGYCTPNQTSDTAILTIHEKPEVTVQPVDKTICEDNNTLFRINTGVTTSPVVQWQVNNGSGWGNLAADAYHSNVTDDTLLIAGADSSLDGNRYRAVVSGTCVPTAISDSASLTVREKPEIIDQPTDSTICEGSSVSFSVNAGVTTGPSYRWQVNTGASWNNVVGALYSGQNTATLNIFNVPSTYNGYRYRIIISGSCTPADTSVEVTLTVRERPEITAHPANAVICEDGSTLFRVNPGVTTSPVYTWEVNDGGGFDTITGGPVYAGYNNDTLFVLTTSSAMNGYSYRVTVSGACTPAVTSNLAFLTVNEKPEVIEDPLDTTICEGQGVLFNVNAGVTTNPSYTWEVNDGLGWATATGGMYINENTASLGLTSSSSPMNGYRYRAIISGTCTPADTSAEAVLSINEKPEIGFHPADTTQCEDGQVTYRVTPGVTTNPTYRWQVDQGFGFFNISGGLYSGITTDTLTITGITSTMNGYKYRVVVSGTCSPSVNSNSALLHVNEKPEVTQHPANSTICEDGNTLFRVNPGVTTSPAYEWEYNTGSGWNPVPADAFHSGLTNDTLFITGALSTMNGYQYRAVVSGTCAPDTASNAATLTINEKPEIAVQPVDSVICENAGAAFSVDAGLTTNPTYQWQVSTGGAFSNVSGGFYAGGTTPQLNVIGATSTMNGYRYRVVIGGSCTPTFTSDTVVLTVLEKPEVTAHPVPKTICEGDATYFRVNAGVTTNATYQWEVDQGSGFNPVVPGPEYSGINSDTLKILGGISAMNNYSYHAVISGTCAPDATSNAATLTIREKPQIDEQPSDTAICEGSSASFSVDAGVTTNPLYQWQVDKNTGSFVNVTGAGYSGQTTALLNLFNASSAMNGYRYRVVITGSCSPSITSDTVTLTVYERPEITAQPVHASICEDGMTQFTVNAGVTTNPAYYWMVNEGVDYDTITGGVYTGFNTNTLLINPATTPMDGYTFMVIVGGFCSPEVYSNEVTLTVDEKPEIVVEPVDSTVCEGNASAFFTDAGVTTNPNYKWQVNKGAAWEDASGSPYTGVTTAFLNLSTTNTAMNGYRYRVIVGGKCTPADTSAMATLTINEKPEVTAQPVDKTECEGGSVFYRVNPGTTANPAYQWQVDQGSGFVDITAGDYTGINEDTLVVSNITTAMNGYRYRTIISGTCTPDATSGPARLYINEKPEVTKHPSNTTICENDNAIFVVSAGVTTAPTYLWELSTDNGSSWNPVPAAAPYGGTTNDTLYITDADPSLDGNQYRAVISGTCTPPVPSNAGILTVHFRPVINTQPVDRIICENGNTSFTVDVGTTTSPTYQWQVDMGSGFNNVGGAVYSGATTATLTITNAPSSMSGNRYRVSIGGACSPDIISDTVLLTVYEKPEVMTQPAAVTVCQNDATLFTVNPGVTTTPAYQWQVDITGGGTFNPVPAASPYSGVTDDTLRISAVTPAMNNYKYRVVISGACTPVANSNGATLTVRNKPQVTTHPVDQAICEDGNTTFTMNAGVTTNPTYQWQVDPKTGTFADVSGGYYSGQNAATLNITGAVSAMNGYRYRVVVGGYCSPAVNSNPATLTIREKPEVLTHPVNKTVCEDGTTTFTVNAGVTTSPTYQWEVDKGTGFAPVAGAAYSGQTTATLTINPVSSTMNTYLYHVVVSGACTPPSTSNAAILYVNEKPEVTVPPADTVICENQNAAFTVNAGVTSNPTYRWQVNTGSGYTNITDGGKYIGSTTSKLSIFNATAVMDGYTYQAVISGTCIPSFTSSAAELTVNTKPALSEQPADTTICESKNTSFSVTAAGTNLTYTWQVDKNDGNGYAAISNGGVYAGATTATLSLSGADRTYDAYNYRVVVDGTCAPPMTSNIARLTVNTAPEIKTEPVTSTICEFNNTAFTVIATGGSLTYQWQENEGSGWTDLSSTGNYIGAQSANLSIFNIARDMDGYQYRVLIGGQCTPDATSATVDLIVNTSPEILAQPADTTVCETITAEFNIGTQGTALTYQWQEDRGGGFVNLSDGGNYSGTTLANLVISNPDPLMTGYRYRVKVNGTCAPPVTSSFANLVVNTFPSIMTEPESDEICEDGNVSFISTATGTGITYQWQEDDGSGFADIPDGGMYIGVNSTILTISDIPVTMNGYKYRLQVTGACAPINSQTAGLVVDANPTVGISGNGMFPLVCGGLDLNLDGNPAGGSGTYTLHTWTGDIGPLSAVNVQAPVFNSIIPGSYDLTYTVTDNKGCKASEVIEITNERPQAQYISDAVPSCGLITVNFTNQSAGAVDYEWDFNDPNDPAISTETDPTHDFTNFTSQVYYYTVSLVALSDNGCGDTTRQIITVYPSIDASFTITPDEGCNPVRAQLSALPGGSSYSWNYGDGDAENGGAVISHEFRNTSGDSVNYTVKLTTKSFYGCQDTKTAVVTVHPIPEVWFQVSPPIQQYPDATFTFTNRTEPGSWTYLWRLGDDTTSTKESLNHTYAGPGDYDITLIASTSECADSSTTSITLTPAAPVADFEQPDSGCAPLTIEFVNLSEYGTSYIWDFGNGSQSYKESPTFTYYESGTYTIKLTVYGPGGMDNIAKTLKIKQTPNAYTNVAPTFVFVNDVPVKCFNLSTDTVNPVYRWYFGDGKDTVAYEPVHIYQEPGRYDITLLVMNENECSDQYTFSYVDVEPAGELIFPNVFRPNPDGPSGGEYRPGEDNNQIFFPGVYDQVLKYELTIYNRWGEQIFISTNVNIGWDGYVHDKLAEQGVYIWKVKGKYANGKTFNHAGDITLLR